MDKNDLEGAVELASFYSKTPALWQGETEARYQKLTHEEINFLSRALLALEAENISLGDANDTFAGVQALYEISQKQNGELKEAVLQARYAMNEVNSSLGRFTGNSGFLGELCVDNFNVLARWLSNWGMK